MKRDLRRALLSAACALAGGLATAAIAADPSALTAPVATPQYTISQPLSAADQSSLGQALEAARLGDAPRIRVLMSSISDPLARKIALWALVEAGSQGMSYAELESARRDLAGWPGEQRRLAAEERVLEGGGVGPKGIIDWFAGADPLTPEGAMALAAAYQSLGQPANAASVIRKAWRAKPFDSGLQQTMLARFGALLTADDHAAREDMLLYGAQGEPARDLLPFLSPDQRALAQARMAVRAGSSDAASLITALPASLQTSPGLAYERSLAFARTGDTSAALALIPSLPTALPDDESRQRMWKLRKELVVTAIKAGDARAAYRAAAGSGVEAGEDGAEAEFYAGWLALSRLRDPKLADQHFAALQQIGASPITLGRALYWRGRAAETMGDAMSAALYYGEASKYQTTFYGQLAAAKVGQTQLVLGKDPDITAADRARFEDREPVRAARLLASIGAKETFWSFTLAMASNLPNAAEAAELVDLTRGQGEQYLSMKIVREAAKHGQILPERGYPLHATPAVATAPETAFVLGIIRQESGFDPRVRSSAGATGMMQLMPATARALARKYGYGAGSLEDADYNLQLGSTYLGQLVGQFGGSYVMAAAGYNAGPNRPSEWTAFCGDPRATSTDPADYIECIPFSETRNYVMRVLEATEVYRARLAGGGARLTLASDLKRGGYGYVAAPALSQTSTPAPVRPPAPTTSAPTASVASATAASFSAAQ